jgi:GTP-sensing pleiotropic transcriptional regulator CodY
MQRSELEHVIRACGEIAGDDEFIINVRSVMAEKVGISRSSF